RQAKGKARLAAYDKLLQESTTEKRDPNEISIPPGPRLGDLVFEAENITKSFGDKLLYENLSFKIPKNAVVGIIGPNGAGKTTLFKILSGQDQPDSGSVRLGDTVKLAYVDQSRDSLAGDNTVYKEISGGSDTMLVGKTEISSRAYCGWFNFKGSDQQKLVKYLSGGERNRVHLAKVLKSGGNVLMLDEPTNDLDVDTLRSLEAALDDFAGCALVISHDRWFLDRIATHILAFEGDSKVVWFEGNFEAYEEDKKKRLGADAVQPTRIKYRKLTKA
ncbi:MAG TPA: ATP-binding cassette domain-containing protein, partial [Polyangiales bacterium]